MKPRTLLCLLTLSAAALAPATAAAVDDPSTDATTAPVTATPSTGDPSTTTDPVPVTIDPSQLEAMQDQAAAQDEDKSVFEKASDFVTDNAPWFIIGIIVLAAIAAGILIMRGRPRGPKAPRTPKASVSNKAMRDAGGLPSDPQAQPAQVPSAAELRRRKRAAIQRQREEERMRRKAGIEGRQATPPGTAPVPPVAAAAAAPGYVDPIEAEKQAARDQQTAAAAVARSTGGPVPAPISPSQTAPAAGVLTPDTVVSGAAPVQEPAYEPETVYEAAPTYPEPAQQPEPAPAPGAPAPAYAVEPPAAPEAATSVIQEPALEAPGPDGTVGEAAGAFLAGGAAGAAGGFAAARAGKPEPEPAAPEEQLEPVISPEPGMAAEYAVADPEPVVPAPVVPEPAAEAAAADDRLRAKVAEIKATQEPAPPAPEIEEPEVAPTDSETDLSPGLASVERQLSANSEERDRVLRDAEERLRRVEQRAEDAERRAAFAERLAQLKVEESERERRLNDVVSGIDRAEQRAREAEERAEAAEKAAAAALERSDLQMPAVETPAPVPEEPEPAPAPEAARPAAPPAPPEPPVAPAPVAAPEPEPVMPPRRGLFSGSEPTAAPAGSDTVNLNRATFEELREAGLSVTQATRILAYRERFGGYNSVEDLEKVPGFPSDLIESLRSRLSI